MFIPPFFLFQHCLLVDESCDHLVIGSAENPHNRPVKQVALRIIIQYAKCLLPLYDFAPMENKRMVRVVIKNCRLNPI